MTRGAFIVFDGPDGTGKTTQAQMLAASLSAVYTREPGGTDLGEVIRTLFKSRTDLSPKAEMFLLMADAAQHVDTFIEPLLQQGVTVVCDRYHLSMVIYQGIMNGLGETKIRTMSEWARTYREPDIHIYLKPTFEVAEARRAEKLLNEGHDKYDAKSAGWQRELSEAYEANTQRLLRPETLYMPVESDGRSVTQVHKEILRGCRKHLKEMEDEG